VLQVQNFELAHKVLLPPHCDLLSVEFCWMAFSLNARRSTFLYAPAWMKSPSVGFKVTNVEIREIVPPRDVQDSMNRQLTAERTRRAVVTESTGTREAAINVAQGDKQSNILKAEGEKQAAILRAEGEKSAQLLRAEGYQRLLKPFLKLPNRLIRTQ